MLVAVTVSEPAGYEPADVHTVGPLRGAGPVLAVGDQPTVGRPQRRGPRHPPQPRGWSCPSSCPHPAQSLARTLAGKAVGRYQQGVASGLANQLVASALRLPTSLPAKRSGTSSGTRCGDVMRDVPRVQDPGLGPLGVAGGARSRRPLIVVVKSSHTAPRPRVDATGAAWSCLPTRTGWGCQTGAHDRSPRRRPEGCRGRAGGFFLSSRAFARSCGCRRSERPSGRR